MGKPKVPGVEDIRYTNPITGVISSQSRYTDEQGIKKTAVSYTHLTLPTNREV